MIINADGLKRESESTMKKAILLLVILVAILGITACKKEHTHTVTDEVIVVKDATCSTDGQAHMFCAECGEIVNTVSIPKTYAHTEVVIPAVDSTCTEKGLTEGKKCSICGEILVTQEETSIKDHSEELIPAVESTCTENGLTEGKKCSICDKVLVAQVETPLKAHIAVVDKAVDATCAKTGLTEGSHCSICGTTLVVQQEIPVVAHTYDDKYDANCNVCGHIRDAECAHRETEIIKGYDATCTSTGLTDGIKCKKCSEILTSQTVINVKDHAEVVDPAVEATCTSTGLTEGKHCAICGAVLVPQTIVPVIDHSYSYVTTAPTCTAQGYTTYTCACGESYISDYVDIISHSFGEWITVKEATTTEEGLKTRSCSCGQQESEVIPIIADSNVSKGLDFIPNNNKDGYSVSIGTCRDEHIIIPDEYNGLPINEIADYAFYQCDYCVSITIGDNITRIGNFAFYGCKSLRDIFFDGTVEQWLYSIRKGEQWNLKAGSYTIYCLDGSIDKYGIVTYYEVTSEGLEFTLNDDRESYSVTGIGTCTDEEIVIPSTYSNLPVTSIADEAFSECSRFTSVVIPNSVSSIGDRAFFGNQPLRNITIPDSIESIGYQAFYSCPYLQYNQYDNALYLGNEDNPYLVLVKAVDKGISSCIISDKTKFIYNPSLHVSSTGTSYGDGAFFMCTYLKEIIIPDSVSYLGPRTFLGCTSLITVTIGDSVTSIGDHAFEECRSLTSVTIGNAVTSIGEDAFDLCKKIDTVHYAGDIEGWLTISFATFDSNPVCFGAKLFFNNELVSNVNIPDDLTSIGRYALYGCISLESIAIPSSIVNINGFAFYGCTSLTSIDVDANNQHYKSIDGNLYTKDGTTLIQYATGKEATSFTISDTVTSIGDCAFSFCTSLTSVEIGDSIKSIGESAFYNCTSLTSIVIPDSVTSLGDGAFNYCTSLTSVEIGDSVTSIGYGVFNKCTSLTSVVIPDSVTSIYEGAFYDCTSLTSIVIPDSVTSIPYAPFYGCTSLTIYCEAKSKPSGWSSYWNASNRPVIWGYTVY